ncbi:Uncharacterised protein [Starkeya nomas]|uniref:Uncharacterized protein n=1 Tax=Starkeya nomas TaxID=2666134 RepID=A0A5S9NZA1_9HYPH|nr:hypothetical protein [Starkeya nomas]CAA0096200.1 Uncharacterised protein [Starkeya nomas]
MKLTLHGPCTRVDLAEVCGELDPRLWVAFCRQLELGPSYAACGDDARALFCGGFIPTGDAWECWFHAAPDAGRHMLELHRVARLTLADLPQSDPRPVETIVRTPAGARIARLFGLRRVIAIDGLELWRGSR